MPRLPSFLGIGVQRAATTWLHDNLASHPEVFVPSEKELHFFNDRFDRGIEWYKEQFRGSDKSTAVGEITPLYLHTAPLIRIHNTLPDAQIILILRDPVDRARSAYELLRYKFFNNLNFQDACNSPRGTAIINHSRYSEKLSELMRLYRREQLCILLYEDVIADPERVIRDVYTSIGVDPSYSPPQLRSISNRILFQRSQERLEKLNLGWAISALKKTWLGESIKRVSKQYSDHRSHNWPSEFMKQLRKSFEADVCRVEGLIGLDLSSWKSHN